MLDPMTNIENRDAILDLTDPAHPTEPDWPDAEFIVGNPPFLGSSSFPSKGIEKVYVDNLKAFYGLHGKSDLCCYWFEKGRRKIASGKSKNVGLIATQSIRHGGSRGVLDKIHAESEIFFGVSDSAWVNEGADVRISMVGFGSAGTSIQLDGEKVVHIFSDLSSSNTSTSLRRLSSNQGIAFEGDQKGGPFQIPDAGVLSVLTCPCANGRPSSDAVVPRMNAEDLVKFRRPIDWVIDFGISMSQEHAALYDPVYEFLRCAVKEQEDRTGRSIPRRMWWIHKCARPTLRSAIAGLARYLVTPRVGEHRTFAWLPQVTLPDSRLFAFATDQDYDFGILHSKVHEKWALRQGAKHGVGNDPTYNGTTCFETFPFPEPTDAQREAVATAAKELDTLRNNWLNPAEWVRTETLEFPGSVDGPWKRYVTDADLRGIGIVKYPRLVPRDNTAAAHLKKRTLTNLYNERPTWLANAHAKLDAAVFAAYGWPVTLSDDDLLAKLLALNLSRAGTATAAVEAEGEPGA